MWSRRSWSSRKGCRFDRGRSAGRDLCEISAGLPNRPDPRPMGRGGSSQTSTVAARAGTRRPRGRPRIWTEEAVEAELRARVAANDGRLPTLAMLERPGLHGLRHAVRAKGIGYWSEQLGLDPEPGRDRSRYGIEHARADAALVVEQHDHLPGTNALHQLGHHRLARFIVKEGGVKRFCARYDIDPRSGSRG